MANRIFRGDAPPVAQVTKITPANVVVGDTFTSSIRRGAFEQLGPIDEVVSVGADRGEGLKMFSGPSRV